MKALAEDPSVFEYDNIYDDLQEKKKKSDPRLQKKDTKVCICVHKVVFIITRTKQNKPGMSIHESITCTVLDSCVCFCSSYVYLIF